MDASHEQGTERAYVPLSEAAALFGVSVDTIRRRIRRGDLDGRKEQTAQGFRWLVAAPGDGEKLPGGAIGVAQPDHAGIVATLQGELQQRNAEIERLHKLLEIQGRALESALERPALPEVIENEAVGSSVSDERGPTHTDTHVEGENQPEGRWMRFKRWYRTGQ